jgi:hypothetical protein
MDTSGYYVTFGIPRKTNIKYPSAKNLQLAKGATDTRCIK